VLTRRYHGLLIAAPEAPGTRDASDGITSRTLLVAKFDEVIRYDGRTYELGANRWKSGGAARVVAPEGFRFIERFRLQGATPVWTFACADALIEKRVWMQDGANTTYVRYDLVRSSATPAALEVKALVNYRNIHSTTTQADFDGIECMEIAAVPRGLRVIAHAGATPYYLLSDAAEAESCHDWYLNFDLAEERSRGLDDREDHLLAGIFRARLAPGESVTFALSTDPEASLDGRAALASRAALEEKLLEYWIAAQPQASLDAPPWIRQLVLAAAQFPVHSQPSPAVNSPGAGAYSVIAGYPWFGEWGRDTMIALPGLTLETGRRDLTRSILRRAIRFVDEGMLPNVFPEADQPAQYNSVDATLWYFDAVRQYYDATSDRAMIEELFPALAGMIDHYVRGTRHAIHVDEADGLLYAGELGVQLTWMDAKVGSQVITARIGKPVEVNALWYNALRTMARFAFALDKPTWEYNRSADRAQAGFARFWNSQTGCCFDVLDGPAGHDAPDDAHDGAIRPNQIFAVSLPESPLGTEQRAAVVDVCMRRLLTPYGLRSLDPADPHYQGHYGGPPAQRDAAYHQGTVWPWLLGPFVLAHLRVHHDPQLAFTFIEPMANHLLASGLGTISEIFDGDPPFVPRGAISQAWSVAEVLRAWRACYDAGLTARKLPRRL
jgi:predicted glycogen debranching enzyme